MCTLVGLEDPQPQPDADAENKTLRILSLYWVLSKYLFAD